MKAEFQVIVLAGGKGSRMTELTAKKPKCLLPIGNKPMIYYPLKLIEKSGFKDVILVVIEMAKREVELSLEKLNLPLNINMITIPNDTDWGTADSLRHISSHIVSDFVVISSDLLTTIDVKHVLDFHRKTDASFTALYFQPYKHAHFVTPGQTAKSKTEKDLIGVDVPTSRLVFLASASDYEDTLSLKRKLLHKHGHLRIYTKLIDSHFFVMKKWLIKYLAVEKNITTIKGELLPGVLKKEILKENKLNELNDLTSVEVVSLEKLEDTEHTGVFQVAKSFQYKSSRSKCLSSYNDHCGDLHSAYMNDYLRSYAFVARDNEFGIRNNTIQDYCKSNRLVLQFWKDLTNEELPNISSEAEIGSSRFERNSSFIDALSKVHFKTEVKSSMIGMNCVILSACNITECIIMNNVTVKENCSLQNCIICDDVVIEANSTIKDCVIGSRHRVPENSNHANEVLIEAENLMEV